MVRKVSRPARPARGCSAAGKDEEDLTPLSHRTQRQPRFSLVILWLVFGLAGDAVAAEGGLVLTPDLELVVALVILFVLLVFPVDALLFRPIFAALDARREQIEGTRARAQELEAEAEASLRRYEASVKEVRAESDEARKAALSSAREASLAKTEGARHDAEGTLERARQEIAGELQGARATLRQQAEALAREAASSVLGRSLS